MIRLGDILPELGLVEPASDDAQNVVFGDVAADSRAVTKGAVFVAVPGVKADGLSFVSAALANGAVAIVGERAPSTPPGAPFVRVRDARAALSLLASRVAPAQPRTIVAVTGTSGKTSVAAFVRQILAQLGHAAAALGTTGVVAPSGATYGSLTTPDPVTLHRTLDQLARDGVTHLAMEASSHGLEQRRLDNVRLSAAGFTNLSRDHLDYHPSMDAYFHAKMRLFGLLPKGAKAVVDVDSDYGRQAAEHAVLLGLETIETGRAEGANLRLVSAQAEPDASRIVVLYDGREHEARLPLAGDFMISNALVAAGLCIACGEEPGAVIAALSHLSGAPGRLEKIGARHGAPVFVDYAHKPDALEKVLVALRPLARRKLVVVFGCGGDRDAGKRPIMGEIASRLADIVIVTDDNPRSEDPAAIRRAILAAAPGAQEIGDRAAAIRAGVDMLEEGDVLVVAGKGHETGQIVGQSVLPFSDHEAVRAALSESTT